MSSFGWGHRQCLGMSLTQDELIVACGSLAWAFTLKPKVDPVTGHQKPVPLDKSNSLLIIKPDAFEMDFEPRSLERREEVLRIWDEAETKDAKQRVEFLNKARAENHYQQPFMDVESEKAAAPIAAVPLSSRATVRVPSGGGALGMLSAVKKQDVIIQINRVNSYPVM